MTTDDENRLAAAVVRLRAAVDTTDHGPLALEVCGFSGAYAVLAGRCIRCGMVVASGAVECHEHKGASHG